MSITTGTEILGGGAGYGFGGGMGIAPVGLIGLNTLFGRGGFGNDGFSGHNGSTPGTTVLEQNVSDLRKDVADNGKEIHVLGNEIAGMFAQQNLANAGEFRNIDNKVCELEKATMQQSFALSNQMSNFQHSVDNQMCDVKSTILSDGDKTRALITQNLIDDLRSQLGTERRGRDNREIEINIQNTNQQTQAQLQSQLQAQNQYIANSLNLLGDQINRSTNSIVNLGNMAGTGQTNSNANTKVNS